jgi:hypothetical protein
MLGAALLQKLEKALSANPRTGDRSVATARGPARPHRVVPDGGNRLRTYTQVTSASNGTGFPEAEPCTDGAMLPVKV